MSFKDLQPGDPPVLKHAASVKLLILAALLSGIEVALPLLDLHQMET